MYYCGALACHMVLPCFQIKCDANNSANVAECDGDAVKEFRKSVNI